MEEGKTKGSRMTIRKPGGQNRGLFYTYLPDAVSVPVAILTPGFGPYLLAAAAAAAQNDFFPAPMTIPLSSRWLTNVLLLGD